MRGARALTLAALAAGAIAGLVACASILGIEDASFAELAEGGGVAEAGPGPTPQPIDASEDGAFGGPEGGVRPCARCTASDGEPCKGACLGSTCSSCACGTRNIAPSASTAATDGLADAYLLTDEDLMTAWAAVYPVPQSLDLVFSVPRSVGRIAFYGPRPAVQTSEPVTTLFVQLLSPAGIALDSQTLYASANGDVVWDRSATPNVPRVTVGCVHTEKGRAPSVSEIEVCGE